MIKDVLQNKIIFRQWYLKTGNITLSDYFKILSQLYLPNIA